MKYRIVYMDLSELLLILTLPGHFYEIYYAYVIKGFPGGSDGKESACNAGDLGSIPGSGRSSGEGMAIHSSILSWRILWTEEPGGLQLWGPKQLDRTE